MKLEPYLYYADGETFTVEAVADLFADDSSMEKLYSESQLKAEIERRDAVLRQALGALELHCSFAKRDGPCAMEDGMIAINAIQDILK